MGPTFSVIMTSFNYSSYIGKAIESVLAQTYEDWELLIVDDRSTDDSWSIIQKFTDPRIKAYLQPVNLGASEAYNFALSMAQGRYIASLDSDDLFMPCKLERQLAFLEHHPEIGICGAFVSEIDRDGARIAGATPHADWFNVGVNFNDPANWIWTNHICHSGAVVRADLHKSIGRFNSNLVSTPDWEFWLRALTAGARFAVIPEQLVAYRNHGGNITQNPDGAMRMSREHARTASELLIPWLMRESRFDLVMTLMEGVVTRIAGQPAVESVMAKELIGGNGAVAAITAALRMIGNHRTALIEAENRRLQLVASQEEMRSRLLSFEHQILELKKEHETESAALRQREIEARDFLNLVNGQRGEERLIEKEKESNWALERASFRRLEVDARSSLSMANVKIEALELLNAKKDRRVESERSTWRRLLAEARQFLRAAESEAVRLNQAPSRGGLKSVWTKLRNKPVVTPRLPTVNADTAFIRTKLSSNGTTDVLLIDLHGASFTVRNHKTLLVTHELSRSGAPRVVLYLARAIRQITGVTPLVWSPVDGEIRAEFEADGFPVIVDSSITEYQSAFSAHRLAISEFEDVIATSISTYQFIRHFGADVKRLRWWIHEEAAGFEYVITELAPDLVLLFEHCAAVWLGSPLCFAPAGQHVDHNKLFLLLYGCKDTSKPSMPSADGRLTISIFGSLEPRKGQDIFVDALDLLTEAQKENFLIRVVGSATDWWSSYESSLHVRTSNMSNIEFIPNVSSEQLDDLYASTDVVVSASRSDPMPIAVTQGLMFAKVCICSSVVGHSTMLQDQRNALIFETENPLHLAEKLAWLIDNREAMPEIGRHGRQVYEASFLESQFISNVDFLLKA